ncbi:protein of unknown function [Paraburkholderia dioscoreae]|uniref:Uncharacterized protein n=1 Tax=Paraburkholderia dioscoreae TaxID=2604047 RepID=A0A5Q4Z235_9BURK|nr:protein of unknown function [Paraburkholderia dioscoreae]
MAEDVFNCLINRRVADPAGNERRRVNCTSRDHAGHSRGSGVCALKFGEYLPLTRANHILGSRRATRLQ